MVDLVMPKFSFYRQLKQTQALISYPLSGDSIEFLSLLIHLLMVNLYVKWGISTLPACPNQKYQSYEI